MLVRLIKVSSFLVFIIPVLLNYFLGNVYLDKYLLALVIFMMILSINGKDKTNRDKIILNINKIDFKSFQIFALSILTSYLAILIAENLNFIGLSDRSSLREEASNYSTTSFLFILTQLEYVLIAITASLISKGIIKYNNKLFFLGQFLAILILLKTGTRWIFLLALSPFLVFLYIVLKPLTKLFGIILFVCGIASLSILRSSTNISLASSLWWDIPSFQSANIINTMNRDFFSIIDFFNGNLFILIPRFIWTNKPIDNSITEYMISIIGDRFYDGATILPGFIGSTYLYGGWFGIIIFSLLFRYIMFKLIKWNINILPHQNLTIISLSLMGLMLQLRGISVFYFMPLIYYFCIVKLNKHSFTRKNKC